MKPFSFIVTGGAGFIGRNIIDALNARGHDDILVVDALNNPEKEANLASVRYAEFMDKDAFREALLAGEMTAVKTVFHLGACSSTMQLDVDFLNDNNVLYTQQVCTWCSDNDVRFIYASSAATYGDGEHGYSDDEANIQELKPLNPYGQSKQDFDLWARERGLLDHIVGLKYFNVYGPFESHKGDMRSVVNKAYGWIQDTGELSLFKSYRPDFADGEQNRDFIYVKDAVAVTLFFHDHPEVSGLFNCGTGEARTWVDLGRAIFAAMDLEPKIKMIEMPDALRNHYQYHTQADATKLRECGFTQPFMSIEEGVDDYVRNYLAND
ncbi:MAG: ADP-glyceromanno-heptose 6-epimerase [Kiritimatiellae bacterium]|nr:ADP-glyceromanno-heptose 6-epimerase [Kiritimatiellia bacterium]